MNKRLLRILALQSEEVSRGIEVRKLKANLNVIQDDINSFSFGIDDDIDRIKELCIDLKNKIQLKIEEAIAQLNEHKKQMITEVEKFERDCIKSSKRKKK